MVVTAHRMSAADAEHQASSFSGGLTKDLLLCFICSDFYKDPRVLPCQHTFCRSCLERYFSSTRAESEANLNSFPCPCCQTVTQVPRIGVTGFPSDTKLRHMKEVYLNTLKTSAGEQAGARPTSKTDCDSNERPATNKAQDMPYSFQDKENYRNGGFSSSYRQSMDSDQTRPASWYGSQTPTDSGRSSQRASWYGGSATAKPAEETYTPSFTEKSRNPFDRASRFAPRRRRKMERTFDTPDEKVGFRPRDRLEEIINNVREEGSQPKNARGQFYGSDEAVNGRPTGSPSFGAKPSRVGQPPGRSHSFNTHRTRPFESTPESTKEPSFGRQPRSSSFNTHSTGRPEFHTSAPQTHRPTPVYMSNPPAEERPSYFSAEARSSEGLTSPRSHASAFSKPAPRSEPPKFKPKPPPPRHDVPQYTPGYTPANPEQDYKTPSPTRAPPLRRSETDPTHGSYFRRSDGPHPHPSHRFEADARMPTELDISPPEVTDDKEDPVPVNPPSAKIDETARKLYESLNQYCTVTPKKREMKYAIPDVNELLSSSDSSDDEDDAPGDVVNKDRPDCNGHFSPIRDGCDVTDGANTQTTHDDDAADSQLSSDTFSTFDVDPDAEEAFAVVGEVELEVSVIKEEPQTTEEVSSDYDNTSDYDNIDDIGDDIVLKIVESGDEEEDTGAIKPEMGAKTEPDVQAETEVEVTEEEPEIVTPSHPDQINFTPYKPTLLWKVDKDEYKMPVSLAFTSKHHLVVSQYSSGLVEYYDEVGEFQHQIDGIKPFAVTVNKSDQVIVGDRKSKTIRVFDEFGCDVAQWEDNMFKWLSGIATLSDGNFITFDREFCKLRVSSPTGEKIREFGTYGVKDTQFSQVDFITVDSQDRIVICDSGNHCIKYFDSTGKFLDKFGTRGHGDGEMEWPKGICVDSKDNVFVVDSCNKRVSMFSPNGVFLQHLLTDCMGIYNVAFCSPGMLGISQYSLSGKSQVAVYTL